MLNGIGGRIIAEAKDNMSHAEAVQWAIYIRKRGSLNVGRRIDRGFASLTMWLLRVNGAKVEMEDFLPYYEKQPDRVAEPEDVLKLFQAISRQNQHVKAHKR